MAKTFIDLLTETSTKQQKEQLYAEQVKLLYANMSAVVLATLVNSSVLVIMLWTFIKPSVSIIWLTCLGALTALRLLLTQRYRGAAPRPAEARRWGRWFLIGSMCSGVVWGSSGIFLFPKNYIVQQAFLAFILGGMTAGSTVVYSSHLFASIGFILPNLVPITVRFLIQDESIHLAMGGMILLFIAVMVVTAKRMNAVTLNALRLQFKNADLVVDLTRAKENAEKLNQKLEAANEFKSAFLANMSHEIRTPMSGIIGMTEMVLDTELTLEQREYLQTVKVSANSLLSLLNDVLDISKIEAGKLVLEPIDFNLRDTLSDTLHTLALQADQKELELVLHVLPDVPDALVGDSSRLRQIIINLVGNAIKFTEQGEIIVRVKLMSDIADSPQLHFTVSDTGIGIPPEKQESLFNTFEQADISTTRRYGGTGLGLSISKQLVEIFDGKIWLESEVGVGSTFHFTPHFDRGLNRVESQHSEVPANLHGLHVLAVDDNATQRAILQEMLTHWKFVATVVDGAETALATMKEAAAKEPFSLVIADAQMPEVSGLTLVKSMKREDKLRHLPIIMLVPMSHQADAERYSRLGGATYLIKPIKASALLVAIISLLKSSAAPQPPPDTTPSDELPPSMQNLRILLVEDNTVNQKLAVILLKRWGHSVEIANNGKEALTALQKNTFDMVLMDIQMPEMDGFEATVAIRAKEREIGGYTPIIAMTAGVIQVDLERCLEVGMDGYITKPLQRKALLDAMKTVLSTSRTSCSPKGRTDTPQTEVPPVQTPAEIESPAIDVKEFLSHVEGEMELVKELVWLFLEEDYPRLSSELQDAISHRDSRAVERAAHAFKGLVGEFCAQPAYEAALKLEKLGRSGDMSRVEDEYAVFETELLKLKDALSALVN